MPSFAYKAYDRSGELETGSLEAATRHAAEEQLRGRGLTPFETTETRPRGESFWTRDLTGGRGLSGRHLAGFARDLGLLVGADVPLERSLRLLSAQGSPQTRSLASALLADVLSGAALSEALARKPQVFTDEFVNAVRAGEASGKIGVALNRIADLLQRRQELQARLRAALTYPAILIVLGLVSTAIVLSVMVPSITPIFTGNGQQLPSGIAMIASIGAHWPFIVAGGLAVAVIAVSLFRWASAAPHRKVKLHAATLRIPAVGTFLLQNDAGRFARTLSMLLEAGVPLLAALNAARDGLKNYKLRHQVSLSIDGVRDGEVLSRALERNAAMPDLLVQMLGVGEEAGKPQIMLALVAELYEQQSYRTIERLMTLLAPALIMLIALIVGGLIFSVMSAVLSINDLAVK